MIEKISTIKNLAVFEDFDWDKIVLNDDKKPMIFQKINILYGRNYSGKTTLSRIIRAMETGEISDKYLNPLFTIKFCDGTILLQNQIATSKRNIRVFNEDFVRANLRFINNPQDTIEPFAILGDDNNILEDEIASLESVIGSKEVGKESGLYTQLKAENKAYIEAKTAHETAKAQLDKLLNDKATDRTNGIKYKSERFGDQNYTKPKLEADIQTILSETYVSIDNDKQSECEQLLIEQPKIPIVPLSPITLLWEHFCRQTTELLSKKIGLSDKITLLIHDVALNEWVKNGCTLHENKQKNCAFCGSPIKDERWEILHKHFDDESRKLEEAISALLREIEKEQELVRTGFLPDKELFYSKYHTQIEHFSLSYQTIAKKYVAQLGLIADQLIKRKNEITVPLTFVNPVDHSKELLLFFSKYDELRILSNEFSTKLNNEQTHAKKALRLHEVSKFCCDIGYGNACSNIEAIKNEVDKAKHTRDTIQTEITSKELKVQEKRRQLNDEEKGAVKVNEYLNNFFGHNFLSLQAIKDTTNQMNKYRFEIVRDGKRAYHLSEGECSLVAFCYFMAKLDDVETKHTKPIIWIDDPISSLDGNHIFFVYSLIAAEIAEKGAFEQLFVSTHNLDFLKYLRRLVSFEKQPDGKVKSCEKQYFIIDRHGSYSTILQMPKYLKEYGTEFNYLFSCIYKCACINTVDDTNFELFYNFGNNARKFLEIYLFFKYPDFSKNKLQRFFGEEKIPPILTERINNEYSHLEGSIERATMPVEVPEMVLAAKLIINKIKEDNDQYVALLNSIGVVVKETKC